MNILMIEDCPTIIRIVERTLTSYGYILHCCGSNHNIMPLIHTAPFEIILINTNLKYSDSFNICKKIRKAKPSVYIIGINNNGNWQEKTEFLHTGADDCLSFPFPTQELVARIQVIQRRPRTNASPTLRYANLEVIPQQKKAFFKRSELPLTQKEYCLLEYLVRNKERPISRNEFMDHVWDYKKLTSSNTIDVHIQKIRHKISAVREKNKVSDTNIPSNNNSLKNELNSPNAEYMSYSSTENISTIPLIQTIHGIGYKLSRQKDIANQKTDNIQNENIATEYDSEETLPVLE